MVGGEANGLSFLLFSFRSIYGTKLIDFWDFLVKCLQGFSLGNVSFVMGIKWNWISLKVELFIGNFFGIIAEKGKNWDLLRANVKQKSHRISLSNSFRCILNILIILWKKSPQRFEFFHVKYFLKIFKFEVCKRLAWISNEARKKGL